MKYDSNLNLTVLYETTLKQRVVFCAGFYAYIMEVMKQDIIGGKNHADHILRKQKNQ
jgi:hypothetical protein